MDIRDIDDGEVSDVTDKDIDMRAVEQITFKNDIEMQLKVEADVVRKFADRNIEFMKEFIRMYAKDPKFAKAMYYRVKIGFDVNTPDG